MITDIWTIVWKELKELVGQRGGLRGGWVGLSIFVVVFGVFMPLQVGREWVESAISLVYWAWVPFLMVSSVVADSFAGERERHTLETLLASRLSDRSILFGKISAAIAYGWGLTLVSVLLGLITINVVYGHGSILFYPPDVGVGILMMSFLVSWLSSGLGVLVSLRAATVKQAQQTFSIVFFLLFIPIFFIPMLPREWQAAMMQVALHLNVQALIITAVIVLVIVDLGLLLLAMARFQRARLILD
jgi:ABC-2 type transport system permease protein